MKTICYSAIHRWIEGIISDDALVRYCNLANSELLPLAQAIVGG